MLILLLKPIPRLKHFREGDAIAKIDNSSFVNKDQNLKSRAIDLTLSKDSARFKETQPIHQHQKIEQPLMIMIALWFTKKIKHYLNKIGENSLDNRKKKYITYLHKD